MSGYWVIRTYNAGGVAEKTKFFVHGERPPKRISRHVKSEIRKQEQNEASAIKTFARLLNANFKPGDIFVSLTYSQDGYYKLSADMPDSADAEEIKEEIYSRAEHQMQLFFRRVKRAADKADIDFKYLGVTSDYDPKHGKSVRVHHHIVMPADVADIVKEKWNYGTAHILSLKIQDDYMPLAEYMLRQVRHVPDRKKYTPSRNLIRPEPKDRIALNESELRIPKGAKLIYRAEHRLGQPQYLRYFFPEQRFKDYLCQQIQKERCTCAGQIWQGHR